MSSKTSSIIWNSTQLLLLKPEKTNSLQPRKVVSSPSPSTQSRLEGGFDDFDNQPNMRHMFAAMTLPEVELFKDPQGKGFDEFIMRFNVKYGSLGLHNEMLVHLLFSKLDGYPKAVAEALPRGIREGGFQDIVESLQSRFRANDSENHMKAYMELTHLKMTTDVTRYCLQLENLSRRAYPDASEEELSRTRAGELVSQLVDWPEYLQLFTTMELAPKHSAYEMVKTTAQRCERGREVATTMRDALDATKQRPSQFARRKPQVVGRREKESRLQQEVETGPDIGKKTPAKQSMSNKRPMKCYNCNELGHIGRDYKREKLVKEPKEKGKGTTGSGENVHRFVKQVDL
ncbi:hypothetical protein Y032_0994g3334 [Ancylostoma ceylanicum]|uniref:CCHC-type domain-containing protein n=1 Tax=Ancylostoma ceylanicum TaxID=53326 RepID=A0A016W8U2_9BILA|nr:hypothetical protein Y032_0994g3334 [Ancylostoma ceylanicum]